jgi:diguanylate cyclase (GGDEF)-like protein
MKLFILISALCIFSFYAISASLEEIEKAANGLDGQVQLDYLHEQLERIEQLTLLEQVRYWHMLGMSQDRNAMTQEAYDSFTKAINIFEENNLPLSPELPLAYIERSYMTYILTYDVDQYCPDRVRALELVRQVEDSTLLVKILIQNAFCYSLDSTNLNQALALLNEAIRVADTNNLPPSLYAMIYNASGNIYRNNHALEQAYDYLLKAHDVWKELKDYPDVFSMQHSLVAISIDMKEMEKAQQHVEQLFAMAKEHTSLKDFNFFSYYNAGLLAMAKHDFQGATAYFDQAIALQDTTQEKYFVRRALRFAIIAAYRHDDHERAKSLIKVFMQQYQQANDQEKELQSLEAFYAGNYQQALDDLYQHVDNEISDKRDYIRQMSFSSRMIHSDNLLKLDNQILKQNIEINKLQLAEQKSKNKIIYLYLSLIGLFIVCLLAFMVHLVITRRKFKISSQTDFLTGISNRRHSFEQGEYFIHQAKQVHQDISVLLFDVDHFKKVNDLLGHEAGDNALKLIVEKAKLCLRKTDMIGRIGGEEFLVILRDTDLESAKEIAERIRIEIARESVHHNGVTLPLSVSIGITCSKGEDILDEMVARADKALYKAKNNGRNCIFID